MAEYIDREKLLEELKESAKYHADTSREDVLLYRDRTIIREQPTVDVIPLEKIKQAYVEIENLSGQSCRTSDGVVNEVLDILDRLITESEGDNGKDKRK